MDAKTLPQLRAELRTAEARYQEAMQHYFAAYGEMRVLDVLDAHIARSRACGAALDAALGALIDALWVHLADEACAAEQRRLQRRRTLLAQELRLLAPA